MDWVEVEEQSKKLKREEMKVRGLNQNGRVDFSIQEYVSFRFRQTSRPKYLLYDKISINKL